MAPVPGPKSKSPLVCEPRCRSVAILTPDASSANSQQAVPAGRSFLPPTFLISLTLPLVPAFGLRHGFLSLWSERAEARLLATGSRRTLLAKPSLVTVGELARKWGDRGQQCLWNLGTSYNPFSLLIKLISIRMVVYAATIGHLVHGRQGALSSSLFVISTLTSYIRTVLPCTRSCSLGLRSEQPRPR